MVIPKGTSVGAPIFPIHIDRSGLSDPEAFDGFRWSRMNEESTGPTKNQMVNTDPSYRLFGHGTHAWYLTALC